MNRRQFLSFCVAAPIAPRLSWTAPVERGFGLAQLKSEGAALAYDAEFTTSPLVSCTLRYAVSSADWRALYGSVGE